jgi:phage FluMu protein Com
MLTCTVCYDDLEADLVYRCQTNGCEYQMCTPCIKRAFEDSSGQSTKKCPMCESAMARDILQNILGKGAIKAVENELRTKVEFDLKGEAEQREKAMKDMGKYTVKASALFNQLSEHLNMKCPRCRQVFDDYDGCNALTCGNSDCRAAICAICLKDCGSDAHGHVQASHGGDNMFNRKAFEDARKKRDATTVESFMSNLNDETFEVKQMVKNIYNGAPCSSSSGGATGRYAATIFLENAKQELRDALRSDRLGVLKDQEDKHFQRNGLNFDNVSPRCSIPEDYKLELLPSGEVCTVQLSRRNGYDIRGIEKWELVDLEQLDKAMQEGKDLRRVDALFDIVGSLRCAVVAFHGENRLYQTKTKWIPDDVVLATSKISIGLYPIDDRGDATEDNTPFGVNARRIVGMNQNSRLIILQKHIDSSEPDSLMFGALRQYIGAQEPRRVFDEIPVPAPKTFEDLNDQQKQVAHPLALMTAMEVAGPPGTGKTKTITELIRCILECTDSDTLILSERNGAIDAIAEKFVDRCVKKRRNGLHEIKDLAMWTNLLVVGSSGSIGKSAKLFTVEEKLT